MQDLNDLYYFVQVVDHGGFAPAARAIGVQKSLLSRRVAALEDAFDIMVDMDDIIDLSSFEKGKEILRKYDVEI